MQRVLPVLGGLKAYLAKPDVLVNERSRQCPFCREQHRLRLHGHYHRHVLVDAEQSASVPVRRLLCVQTGKTVSLLPDFCIPRRQHGPSILGLFLAGYAGGQSLLAALRSARPDAANHSVAQSLLRGFLARSGAILTYLAQLRHRAVEPPPPAPGLSVLQREVSKLVAALCLGYASTAQAFVLHGVGLHAMQQIGLA